LPRRSRCCRLAWSGAIDAAFEAWQAALDNGAYDSPDGLVAYPQPSAVRLDPRFERVVTVLRERREEMRRRAPTT
jgi:hypothetical protein